MKFIKASVSKLSTAPLDFPSPPGNVALTSRSRSKYTPKIRTNSSPPKILISKVTEFVFRKKRKNSKFGIRSKRSQ